MAYTVLVAAALCLASVASAAVQRPYPGGCRITPPEPYERRARMSVASDVAIAPSLDWRDVNGTNWCTLSRNQHLPQYCGSCWAMASTSALSDRIRIQRRSRFPDFELAPQTVVYCAAAGCNGGSGMAAYDFIQNYGLGTETCAPYVAQGGGAWSGGCTAEHACKNCGPNGTCWAVKDYLKFGISNSGNIRGIQQMKAELQNGPIACGVDAPPIWQWGFDHNSINAPIFTAGQGKTSIDHEISVIGYGHDAAENMDYWIIRNSWGEYWGDLGYFRLKMGEDQLGIESGWCAWATPIIPQSVREMDARRRVL